MNNECFQNSFVDNFSKNMTQEVNIGPNIVKWKLKNATQTYLVIVSPIDEMDYSILLKHEF